MKRFLWLVWFSLMAPGAFAQSFPAKPLRLIVPYPAGGATGLMARLVAQKLSASLKQQVIVGNKPGATGLLRYRVLSRRRSFARVLPRRLVLPRRSGAA